VHVGTRSAGGEIELPPAGHHGEDDLLPLTGPLLFVTVPPVARRRLAGALES
jgi:hypothetical protein